MRIQVTNQHVLRALVFFFLGGKSALLEQVCVSTVPLISVLLVTLALVSNLQEQEKAGRDTRVCGHALMHIAHRKEGVL